MPPAPAASRPRAARAMVFIRDILANVRPAGSGTLLSMTDTSLKSTLQTELHTAMRERDQVRSATLRMALTAVTNEEVSGTQARELSDDEVLKVVVKEAKKRREAASAYTDAGRPELSDQELDALVAQAVASTGATGLGQMGQVMKATQPLVAGRAEGGRVAAAVK